MQFDFSQVVVVVAFVLSVFNLWDKIDARIKSAKEPTKLLEQRIVNLETITSTEYKERFKDYDEHFDNDLRRIKAIEEGNRVTQRALLALLRHAIDGNDTDELKKVSKDLNEYLIQR